MTNSITGVPYRDDKAILAWQFGNEMHNASDAWLTEMAAYIKSLDKNHLVSETRHRPGQPLLIDELAQPIKLKPALFVVPRIHLTLLIAHRDRFTPL